MDSVSSRWPSSFRPGGKGILTCDSGGSGGRTEVRNELQTARKQRVSIFVLRHSAIEASTFSGRLSMVMAIELNPVEFLQS